MIEEARGVLVSHPGRQHSHQAALALERAGLLAGYWAGVPSRDGQQRAIPGFVRERLHLYRDVELPDEKARWLPLPVALRRVARIAPRGIEQAIDYFACRAFDWQVASALRGARPAAVMGCEISALSSFRVARAAGIRTILDAASFHHAVQDRVMPPPEGRWLHERIVAVKRAEIELADHVLTVSPLAREGYVEAGCAPERVHAVTIGADLRLFSPGPARVRAEACTFVFAGAATRRKGMDVLLEAFGRVRGRMPGAARLVVVGPRGDAQPLLDAAGDAVEVRGPVAQSELAQLFRDADCLVLPSRHDSFGMVVVEAMACGLPAIVSEMVGARDAIAPGSGWVVPVEDAGALAGRMAWCVQNRAGLAAMRPAARAAAERCSWERYAAELVDVVARILATP